MIELRIADEASKLLRDALRDRGFTVSVRDEKRAHASRLRGREQREKAEVEHGKSSVAAAGLRELRA